MEFKMFWKTSYFYLYSLNLVHITTILPSTQRLQLKA